MEEGPSATSSIMLVWSPTIDSVADTQWGNSLGPVDFREAYPTGHSDLEANQFCYTQLMVCILARNSLML